MARRPDIRDDYALLHVNDMPLSVRRLPKPSGISCTRIWRYIGSLFLLIALAGFIIFQSDAVSSVLNAAPLDGAKSIITIAAIAYCYHDKGPALEMGLMLKVISGWRSQELNEF
jgi:hypothetical protein